MNTWMFIGLYGKLTSLITILVLHKMRFKVLTGNKSDNYNRHVMFGSYHVVTFMLKRLNLRFVYFTYVNRYNEVAPKYKCQKHYESGSRRECKEKKVNEKLHSVDTNRNVQQNALWTV
ncbi:hypothetical protein L9F63_009803, partial [Diploptera punctata]